MKKILSLAIACLLLAQQGALALTQVFSVAPGTAWNSTNFFTLSSRIFRVDISTGSGAGATNLTYALIDAPTNNGALGWGPIRYTNSAYSQVSQYLTNITKITTNFSGFLVTNIFTNAVYSYTNTVVQSSNEWRRLASGSVASNSTATAFTSVEGMPVIYGLGFTNNNIGATITLTVVYDPAL